MGDISFVNAKDVPGKSWRADTNLKMIKFFLTFFLAPQFFLYSSPTLSHYTTPYFLISQPTFNINIFFFLVLFLHGSFLSIQTFAFLHITERIQEQRPKNLHVSTRSWKFEHWICAYSWHIIFWGMSSKGLFLHVACYLSIVLTGKSLRFLTHVRVMNSIKKLLDVEYADPVWLSFLEN